MAGPSRDQAQTGKESSRHDRTSPPFLPVSLPVNILEFLQDSETRARVVPPPDSPQGPNDANHPFEIVNEAQLQQWATTEPAQLLDALNTLRNERDLGRETAEFYDQLPDDGIWKERYESGKQKRKDLERAYNDKKTRNEFLQEQLTKSQNAYEQLRRERARSGTPSSTSTILGKRSQRLPDPDLLTDGKGTAKGEAAWDDWIHKIHDKLEVNHDHYENERSKIAYVCSRTAGRAATILWARRRKDSTNPYLTADQVLEDLARNFDDPDRHKNARRDFKKLMQGTKTFHDFFSEFMRLATILDVPERDLIDHLEDKIAPRLNNMLMGMNHTTMTIDQTRDYLIKLDNSQRSAAARKLEALQDSQRKDVPLRESARAPKQVTFRKPVAFARDASPRFTPNSQRKEDVDEARCFICHRPGHLAADCPDGKKSSPPVRRSTPVNNVEASADDIDDYDRSSSSASESGN